MSFPHVAARIIATTVIVGSLHGLSSQARAGDVVRGPVNPGDTIDTSRPPVASLPDEVVFDAEVGGRDVRVVEVTNEGESDINIIGVGVSGEAFELLDSDCQTETVGPQESCSIEIAFVPQRAGDFDGSLAVEVNGGGVETAALSGSSPSTSPTTQPSTTTGLPTSTLPSTTTTNTPTTTLPVPTTSATTVTTSSISPPATTANVPTSPPSTDGSPSTTEPGDSSPDDSIERGLRDCERRAADAAVEYTPQQQMTVGEESDVTVVIRVGGDPPSTVTGTTVEPTPTTIVEASLACFIELRLTGTNFEIEDPIKSGDFMGANRREWSWDVTPLRAGMLDLDLSIIPEVQLDGRSMAGTPQAFDRTITVTAAPRSAWQRISDWGDDVVGNSLFQLALATGLLGAGGAAIGGRVRKLRRSSVSAQADDPAAGDDESGRGYL